MDPGILTTVALACRDGERLRFSYTAADGQHTERHVEPHRLVLLGRRWYLVGYDLGRQDWRSFRLDRLTAPRGTGMRFRPRTLPAADAAAFVRAGLDSVFAAYDVEVVVEAPAADVRQRIGRWSTVEDIDAARCRVRMTADSLDWPIMALGAVGADFQVVSPPELLDGSATGAADSARPPSSTVTGVVSCGSAWAHWRTGDGLTAPGHHRGADLTAPAKKPWPGCARPAPAGQRRRTRRPGKPSRYRNSYGARDARRRWG